MPEKQYIFDKPRNVKRLIIAFVAICGFLLLLELVVHRHTEHAWENLIGFYPLYGFISYVLLVFLSRGLRALVMRPEQYYEEAGQNEGQKGGQQSVTQTDGAGRGEAPDHD